MPLHRMLVNRSRLKLTKVIIGAFVVCAVAPFIVYSVLHGDGDAGKPPGVEHDQQLRNINVLDNKGPAEMVVPAVNYDKNVPLIWIGGVPRSGTTLARAMLDAHPQIRCGEETRIIPRMLSMHGQILKSELERKRLGAAKISESLINSALGAYLLSIIVGHGEPANRLCNKDPFALKSIPRLSQIFPRSKFILMVRDGRATVHSIVTRKVTIRGFDHKTYMGGLRDWNRAITKMYTECMNAGTEHCLPVFYEQLVLHPKQEMEKILSFLNVEWNNAVLHHETAIGKAGGISLSERELSTDQVDKPVNLGALTKWVDFFPEELKQEIDRYAPMLKQLGYDTHRYPPYYGTPDEEVLEQSRKLEQVKKKQNAMQR